MHFIFVDNLPANISGKYAHYKHRSVGGNGWEYCDIRRYIGLHQDRWLNDVERWHSELSKIGLKYTKWWWLMPASRLIAWHPPIFNPIFFVIALIEYCEMLNDKEFYVVDCPVEVYNYLQELKPEYCISYRQKISKLQLVYGGRLFIRIFLFEKKKRLFLKYLMVMKNLLGLAIRCLPPKKNLSIVTGSKLVVYSHMLNAYTFVNNGDHFFGRMFDDISGLDQKNILWLLHSTSKKEIRITDQYMRSKGRKAIFLFDLLNLIDFIKIVFISIRLAYNIASIKNELPPLKINKYQSYIFREKFSAELLEGILPITDLSVYFAINRLLKPSHVKAIIYPYEEKGLERAIIYACKSGTKDIRTIGFAHAVYNKGFLYLRNRTQDLINSPKPDIIAATGPSQKNWLVDWAKFNPEKIMVVGSPRYQDHLPLREKFEDRQNTMRVLIIIGQGYELGILANYLEEDRHLFGNCEILIRRYPYGWNIQQDEAISRFAPLLKDLHIGTGSLVDQLSWCDVAIYSSTSAGIEAMLAGRLAVYVELHDIMNLDPLIGKGDLSKVYQCSNPSQLKTVLREIKAMSTQEYCTSIQKQREFASRIYAPVNNKNLSQFLESIC